MYISIISFRYVCRNLKHIYMLEKNNISVRFLSVGSDIRTSSLYVSYFVMFYGFR